MRRIDVLITQSRASTENKDFSEDAGIQDSEFLEYFNNAQDAIFSRILNLFPDVLEDFEIVDVTQSVEAYDIPRLAYLGERVTMVEYSRSGREEDYYPLKKGSKRERLNGSSGNPSFYIRQSGQVLIQPKPEVNGKLRITYQKAVPALDLRRGTILSTVLDLADNTIDSLILDFNELIDDEALTSNDYITVVDRLGNVKMMAIPILAVDVNTGVITIDPSFTFEDGETITAGDYVLAGKYASTHSGLKDVCEKYMLEYTNTRIAIRDSSADSSQLAGVLSKIEEGLQMDFGEPDGDVNNVPLLDTQFLNSEDY